MLGKQHERGEMYDPIFFFVLIVSEMSFSQLKPTRLHTGPREGRGHCASESWVVTLGRGGPESWVRWGASARDAEDSAAVNTTSASRPSVRASARRIPPSAPWCGINKITSCCSCWRTCRWNLPELPGKKSRFCSQCRAFSSQKKAFCLNQLINGWCLPDSVLPSAWENPMEEGKPFFWLSFLKILTANAFDLGI